MHREQNPNEGEIIGQQQKTQKPQNEILKILEKDFFLK
jgi:hypothetical protein